MTNPLDFTGKVALVTGAAAGMGLATGRAFAEAGVSLHLCPPPRAAGPVVRWLVYRRAADSEVARRPRPRLKPT